MQKTICIFIVTSILVLHTAIFAQPYFEFDAHYGFGVSELSFNSVPGIGFSVYPFKKFGFSTGVEYSWRWQTETNKYSGSNPKTLDDEGDELIFKYSVMKYEEERLGRILQIPILFKYNDNSYYAAAGIKIGIPMSTKTNINYRGLETVGYYPEYDLTLTVPSFQGFGFRGDSAKTKISKVKNLFMLALEGGVKLRLSNKVSLLAGAFADYSLNNSFDRTLPPVIERVQKIGSADIVANDTWKSWQPWSVGVAVKFAFGFGSREEELQPVAEDTTVYEEPNITVLPDSWQPPIAIEGFDPQFEDFIPVGPASEQSEYFYTPSVPEPIKNREPDFTFDYPEAHVSPNYLPHTILISQIADALRIQPSLQLHCVGYSEKLKSEFFAYETAFQRALRIRQILSNLYGINEENVYIYSQGSVNSGGSNSSVYRKVECFLMDTY